MFQSKTHGKRKKEQKLVETRQMCVLADLRQTGSVALLIVFVPILDTQKQQH